METIGHERLFASQLCNVCGPLSRMIFWLYCDHHPCVLLLKKYTQRCCMMDLRSRAAIATV